MSKTAGQFISIKFKVTFLILLLSLTSLIGMGVLAYNGLGMQKISYGLTKRYDEALAGNYFYKFNDFLNSIQASSGISQDLAETYYRLKNSLSRQELAKSMEEEYHAAFARETNLLGGGAFFEPHAFYPEIKEFHYFASKDLSTMGASEANVRWVGDEWSWDVDTYEEGWYLVALPKGWNRATPRSERYYWSELYVDTSVEALMITVSLPIYNPEKRIVGVSTVDVSLSTLQKMVLSFDLPTPSTNIAGFSVVNNATFATSGSDKFDIVPYPEGSWLNKLKELKPGQAINEAFKINGKEYTITASVHASGVGLAMLIPKEEEYAAVNALQESNILTVVIVIIAMIAVIIFAIFAIARWIVLPIRKTFTVLETFSKGDLTQTVSLSGNDEFTQMMSMVSRAQKGIRHIIISISDRANALHKDSQELSSVAAQLADSSKNTVSKSTEVASTTEQMAVNIDAMSNSAEQASLNANDVAGTAEEMSVNMNSIANTIEEMIASINQIASNTDEVRDVATQATSKATNATGVMNKLGSAAKEIGEVTDVIKKIADKTNLLALNATIEAASAGEAGKGFAVVAGEIKDLANQSAKSADDITRRVEHIQSGTNDAIKVISEVSKIIDNINRSVETITEHVSQQTKASNQIASNVVQANSGAKRVAGSIGEVARGVNEVNRNASEAARGAGDVSVNAASMNQIAKENAQGTTLINQNASNLSEISEELKKSIAQFKV